MAVVTVSWLRDNRNRMQRNLDAITTQVERLQTALQEVHDQQGLTPAYKEQRIAEIRQPVVEAVRALVGDTNGMLELARQQKPLWVSKEPALLRQVFNSDPVSDATIRLAKQQQFAALSPSALQSVVDAALLDNDLPTLSVAYNVGRDYAGQAGWRGIALDDISIPEREAALQAIADAENIAILVRQQWTIAEGTASTWGATKLTAARAAIALQQSRKTTAPGSVLHS